MKTGPNPGAGTLTIRGSITVRTADLFIFFGFSCFAYVELVTYLLVWSNPNQSNRRSAVQIYFPYG